jgi:hypothetical protein
VMMATSTRPITANGIVLPAMSSRGRRGRLRLDFQGAGFGQEVERYGSLPSQACGGGSQHHRHALALDETYRLDAQP